MAAIHSLFTFLAPKKVAVDQAYHGTFGVLGLMERLRGTKRLSLAEADSLDEGDVCWIETPVNPYGEVIG